MAARLLAHEVSDLCLGKPPLTSLSISATISHALTALQSSEDTNISIWTCDHHHSTAEDLINDCRCVGKEDVLCPSSALKSPVSVLLSHVLVVVRHVEPSATGAPVHNFSHCFLLRLFIHRDNRPIQRVRVLGTTLNSVSSFSVLRAIFKEKPSK
ncbi:hypothetical protein L1887_25718 [Cichorium endivia]|nr:hypothetical protein L1887_25718 [Cichorium endivia]